MIDQSNRAGKYHNQKTVKHFKQSEYIKCNLWYITEKER